VFRQRPEDGDLRLRLWSVNLVVITFRLFTTIGETEVLRVIEAAVFAALAAFVVFASGAVNSSPGESGAGVVQHKALKEGCEVTLVGEVLGREKRPEGVYDSDLALRVSTADYGSVNVVYSAFRLCHNEVGAAVKEGDRVEVHGKVIGRDRITVCSSKDYYIKKL
jgi:hypothetical protein